jgi:hypothetical protein
METPVAEGMKTTAGMTAIAGMSAISMTTTKARTYGKPTAAINAAVESLIKQQR